MSSKAAVVCLVGLLTLAFLPAAYAQGGTPNLGTAQVGQTDSRWFAEERVFSTSSGQGWLENGSFAVGFEAPMDEKTGFGLMYCKSSGAGKDAIKGVVRRSTMKVLAPVVKRRITGADSKTVASLSLGIDLALDRGTGQNTVSGDVAYQKDVIPAAKLQVEFGQPGKVNWQLAAQAAWWGGSCRTSSGGTVPGFGSVVGLGGGISVPFNKKLTLVGDAMAIVSGSNTLSKSTNRPNSEVVWSAGGDWKFGDSSNTCLSVYASNAIAPTMATSLIAAVDGSVALGVALKRDF